MSKVHPKTRKFATDHGLSIDEEAGSLELNGTYNLAVIVNLKEMNSSVEPPDDVSYVRSRVPGEAIAFFSHDAKDHLKFGFVQFENPIELQRWDWSTANLPEPWETGPPWDSISQYVADLFHEQKQQREDEELIQYENKRQIIRKEAKERLRVEEEQHRKEEEQRRKEEEQRRREEEDAKKREAHLARLFEKQRAFVDVGLTHGLTVSTQGEIGGEYGFVAFDHVDPGGKGEPRPVGLPWIWFSDVLLVAMPKDYLEWDDLEGEKLKKRVLTCSDLRYCKNPVWPENLAKDAPEVFDEFLYERRAHRRRKPDFFAPDLYDADTEEPYLVAGLLPEVGISLFVGEWDAGKTILLVDLAAHVAYGSPWLNKRAVLPRSVIYYALEAGDDVSKRFCATSDKLKRGEGALLGVGNVPVRLENKIPHEYDEWREQVDQLARETRGRVLQRCVDQEIKFPHQDYPSSAGAVVIVDTLRQACGHKSRGPEVEEFFSKVDRLVKDGAASHVIIAHHTTKTGDEYAGDDFLASDSTSLYYVRRPNHDKPTFRLVCDRVKGIGKAPAISLSFKVVGVGKQQTVVLVGENDADPKLLGIASSLPARIALDGLREALEPHLTGKTGPAQYKAFQRLRDKLLEAGLIVLEGSEYLRST